MAKAAPLQDTSIRTYRAKRNFALTSEPQAEVPESRGAAPIFVVQKHAARRAGLHWDFRLEHDGVLWSWAVRKGPSLDPADKRLAAHVEDHPLDYAEFQGTIPEGQYGAGTVETWDRGTWEPIGDPERGMRKGDLKFVLHGQRLNGRFHLVQLRRRERERQDSWWLIKGHDEYERTGVDATAIEAETPLRLEPARGATGKPEAPAPGAKRAALPKRQEPQLAQLVDDPPDGEGWLSEIKLDGYRLLVWLEAGKARLVTRNGHDWTPRLPRLASTFPQLRVQSALLDGEMVALRPDGVSSFHELQAALSEGRDASLFFYLFDLLHLDGWDLRPCKLIDRKRLLSGLSAWQGALRYSDHVEGDPAPMRREACRMGLEGIVCKRADAPYRAGRGKDWLKVKCHGREEFVVLGWTPPGGSRPGIGSLQVGYYDPGGKLHYAGGVGSGYSERELEALREKLDGLATDRPAELLLSGDPPGNDVHWVRPELVAEVQYTAWSGEGRIRHPVFVGLREDKPAREVVQEVADPESKRSVFRPRQPRGSVAVAKKRPNIAVPPLPRTPVAAAGATARRPGGAIVTARAPRRPATLVGTVEVTHPDRPLWPGITKLDLAEYWQTVAEVALPGLKGRPLAVVRYPEGIDRERFFQKRGQGLLPKQVREGEVHGSPYLAIDDAEGLIAMAQMSAIEVHPWGATEADPLYPDFIVFDLDPGEGVPWSEVIRTALEVRERLERLKLVSFCRTTGGKGLHIVVPLTPSPEWDWERVKDFCRAFAELMVDEAPERYVAHVKIADRRNKILVDWLRNGMGNTAIGSYCPRARSAAPVATPLDWHEVTPRLDPAAFTIRTMPDRLARGKREPWHGYFEADQTLPLVQAKTSSITGKSLSKSEPSRRSTVIVTARKPRPR